VPARAATGVGGQKEPGWQGVQTELPMDEAKVPWGQRLHVPNPCPAWNMPAGHSWQVVPEGRGCMVPAGHTVHVVGGPAPQANPAGHGVHEPACAVDVRPAGQGVQ